MGKDDFGIAPDWLARARVIAAEFGERAAVHDAEDRFVEANYARLKQEGYFAALVPAELGGGGASISDMCGAIRIFGAACGSTALAFAMHSHLVAVAAWRWRHQGAPTEELLKRVANEGLVLVSSGGSDWLASGGTATPCDGGYRITARKPFSSGSPAADLLVTSAVLDDPAGPTVLHFAVPLKAEGVRLLGNWQVMGMRGTGSQDIELDRVFVPDAAISGRRPAGIWHMLFHIIAKIAFALIYSAYVGVADGARVKALAAATKRAGDDGLSILAGEMENEFAAAEMAWGRMVEIAESDAPGPVTTSRAMTARTLVAKAAIATVEKAMDVAGGAAFYRKTGTRASVSRHPSGALSSAPGTTPAAARRPPRARARYRRAAARLVDEARHHVAIDCG